MLQLLVSAEEWHSKAEECIKERFPEINVEKVSDIVFYYKHFIV